MFPDPGGGAVGGALVVSKVGEASGVSVGGSLVEVGVNFACAVSCAATVCATDVAIIESVDAAGAQLPMRRAAQISEVSVPYVFLAVILASFRAGNNYTCCEKGLPGIIP